MVKRFYRTFTLTMAGMLSLLFTMLPAQSAAVTTEMEKPLQAQPVASKRTATNKKGAYRFKKQRKAHASAFVSLSYLILRDTFMQNITETAASAFDPAFGERIASTTVWGNDYICIDCAGLHKKFFPVVDAITPRKINIPPLLVKKKFFPSGNSLTVMFHDPMTLSASNIYGEFFESNNGAIIQFDSNKPQESNPELTAKNTDSPLAYSYRIDNMAINTGVSWITDIADSKGLYRASQRAGFDNTFEKLSGVNLNVGASYRAFSLTGGYIRAFDRYAPVQFSLNGNETEPSAWTSELAYTTELLRKETTLAFVYQKSSESLKSYLPEQRYTSKISMALFGGTTVSLEYYIDRDFSVDNGKNNEDGYGVLAKVGFEFQVAR